MCIRDSSCGPSPPPAAVSSGEPLSQADKERDRERAATIHKSLFITHIFLHFHPTSAPPSVSAHPRQSERSNPAFKRVCNLLTVTPTRCWASYSNGFCFRNMIPCSFDYLIYPYYPAYTMGCYQIVISHDNGRQSILLFLCWFTTLIIAQKAGNATAFSAFSRAFITPINWNLDYLYFFSSFQLPQKCIVQ